MDIRRCGEPGQEAFAHLVETLEPCSVRLGASRHVETAVWREIAHDAVDVVSIEGVRQPVQRSQNR